MKAAMSAGSGEKTGGDAKLYKMGSGETCTLKYTAAVAGKAKFMMLAATKTGNVSHGFHYDDDGKPEFEEYFYEYDENGNLTIKKFGLDKFPATDSAAGNKVGKQVKFPLSVHRSGGQSFIFEKLEFVFVFV